MLESATEPRVIRAGTLIDGTGAPPVRDATVVIADGAIAYAGPAAGAPDVAAVPVSRRLDAPEGTVLPGLIESHVHLTFNTRTAANSPAVIEQLVTDDDWMIAIRAVQAAQACLGAGITTVRDCGAKGLVTMRLRDLIAAGFINGPRVLACGMPITTTAGHCHWCGLEANNEQEVILATRRMAREGADFIKVMATGGGMTDHSNINEPQYSVAELTAIRSESHRLGRRVTAHSHAGKGQRNCLEAGIDMIEHCNWHTPDGWEFDEALMHDIVQAGMYIGITLSGPQQAAAAADTPYNELPESLRVRYETLHEMRAMGAKIVLHSDAIAPITTYEDFPFSLVAAVRYGGFSPVEAIHASTGLAAEAIGLAGVTGTLTPGQAADVLVVDGDLAADIRAITRTRQVLRDGRVVATAGWVRATPSAVPGHELRRVASAG
jgi:imidazolonepropionase-like amidohydrolase